MKEHIRKSNVNWHYPIKGIEKIFQNGKTEPEGVQRYVELGEVFS